MLQQDFLKGQLLFHKHNQKNTKWITVKIRLVAKKQTVTMKNIITNTCD